MSGGGYIVCTRAADVPDLEIEGIIRLPCSKCKRTVVVSPTSQLAIGTYPNIKMICNQCWRGLDDGTHEIQLPPGAYEEAVREFGQDVADMGIAGLKRLNDFRRNARQ